MNKKLRDKLEEKLKGRPKSYPSLIEGVLLRLKTDDEIQLFLRFLDKYPDAENQDIIKLSIMIKQKAPELSEADF